MSKPICVDFDGVIHRASKGYKDGEIYDKPVEGAVYTLSNWIDQGYRVVILTAREESEFPKIKEWLDEHNFPEGIEITNKKIPALAYIDNRAIRFTRWSDIYSYFI